VDKKKLKTFTMVLVSIGLMTRFNTENYITFSF